MVIYVESIALVYLKENIYNDKAVIWILSEDAAMIVRQIFQQSVTE